MFEKIKLQLAMLYAYVATFIANTRAGIGVSQIVGLAIGLIVAAAIIPTAVVDITNTTLWEGAPASVLTLVPVIGIVVVVALLMMVIRNRR